MIAGRPLPDWSVEGHLNAMDDNGIAASVLSLPGGTNFLKGSDARDAARAINEYFADIIARFPSRFGAFAVLPLDDTDAALEEMRYAMDVLQLDGISSDTHLGGVYLGDPSYDRWFEEMHRRSATLFVHPTAPPGSEQAGIGLNVAILEFMFDTTRMVANLVLSGRKQRFSKIKIISTHGGGTAPYLASRISILAPIIGAEAGRITLSAEEVLTGMGSFYYDLTASTAAASLDALLHLVPAAQLLMGFDYPMMPTSTIAPAQRRFVEYEKLTPQEKRMILSQNAQGLFPRLASAIATR